MNVQIHSDEREFSDLYTTILTTDGKNLGHRSIVGGRGIRSSVVRQVGTLPTEVICKKKCVFRNY